MSYPIETLVPRAMNRILFGPFHHDLRLLYICHSNGIGFWTSQASFKGPVFGSVCYSQYMSVEPGKMTMDNSTEIKLDQPNFQPGDKVSGIVMLDLVRNEKITGEVH